MHSASEVLRPYMERDRVDAGTVTGELEITHTDAFEIAIRRAAEKRAPLARVRAQSPDTRLWRGNGRYRKPSPFTTDQRLAKFSSTKGPER